MSKTKGFFRLEDKYCDVVNRESIASCLSLATLEKRNLGEDLQDLNTNNDNDHDSNCSGEKHPVDGVSTCDGCGMQFDEKRSRLLKRMDIIHRNRDPCKNITMEFLDYGYY